MTLRPATSQDIPALNQFLAERAETSMFLRANIRRFGVEGGSHPHAMRVWVTGANAAGEAVSGVIGHSARGYVSVQMPCGLSEGVAEELAQALAGAELRGMTGPAEQVSGVVAALGLDPEGARHGVEPLYRLDLSELQVPDGPGQLRVAREADIGWLAPWRHAYTVETGTGSDSEAARADVARWIADEQIAVLEDDGARLAMTGFNARLPDMVQVGGVFTPPDLRGRGHARRAVALHLDQAQKGGVTTAILFAASAAASRAYEAIGFKRIGDFQLLVYPTPRRIGATS